MPQPPEHPRPWLIAAWPGMGNVAVLAAGYLVQELKLASAGELPAGDYFDLAEISVREGLIKPVQFPRGLFFRWKNPGPGRDLIVFLGEAQPSARAYDYAGKLLDMAQTMDVERVITFASMASNMHPSDDPKVTGVATDAQTLAEMRRAEVEPLADGEIGGLNGILLAAAAARGIPGFCLLAEIPYFAAAVPNPKAARVALSVFSVLAGIEVNLEALSKHAQAIDRMLIEALEKMNAQREQGRDTDEDEPDDSEPTRPAAPEVQTPSPSPAPERQLDEAARARLEQLFEEARKDSARTVALKQELDRLGVFKQYENRFLDLFRRAG